MIQKNGDNFGDVIKRQDFSMDQENQSKKHGIDFLWNITLFILNVCSVMGFAKLGVFDFQFIKTNLN